MASNTQTNVDRIRQRAFELWQEDGCPEGRDLDYWLRAESELAREGTADFESPPGGHRPEHGPDPLAPDVTPADEPSPERTGRARAPRRTKATTGADEPAPAAAPGPENRPAAGNTAAKRGEYVAQRRTRKKAEG